MTKLIVIIMESLGESEKQQLEKRINHTAEGPSILDNDWKKQLNIVNEKWRFHEMVTPLC